MNGQRTAIYTRVSSDKQEIDGSSLGTQLEAIRTYANEHDYKIVGEITDTWTGSQYRERPGLSELRDMVRSGSVDVVICYALDRLSRDQTHTAVLVDELEHYGARLELVTESFDDTPVGRMVRNAQAFAAEIEREKIVERVMRGKRARVESGRLLPGPRPLYGYLHNEDRSGYVVNPETAPIVVRIYDEYAAGASIRAIAHGLTQDGIPTPTGRNPVWNHASVRNILQHAGYAGKAYGWGYRDRRGEYQARFDATNAIELPDGTIPALVSQEVWEAAQFRLATNKQRARRNAKDPEAVLLRGGYVKCGYCGNNMNARQRGNGGYDYWCQHSGTGRRTCNGGGTIIAKTLDAAVWDRVRYIMLDDDVIEKELERLRCEDNTATLLDGLGKRLAHLERRISNMTAAIGGSTHPDAIAALTSQLDGLYAQRRELQVDIDAAQQQRQDWQERREELERFYPWRSEIAGRLDSLSWQQKRDLLDLLGMSAQVWRATHEPRYLIRAEIAEAVTTSSRPIIASPNRSGSS